MRRIWATRGAVAWCVSTRPEWKEERETVSRVEVRIGRFVEGAEGDRGGGVGGET